MKTTLHIYQQKKIVEEENYDHRPSSNIEQDICDSHLKGQLNEESRAVAKIKSDPNYFFRYAKRNSICNGNVGPLLNPNTHLLTND